VFLERDRMMKMSVGDEQDVGAGWRYGRKRKKKDSQLQLNHQLYEKTGRKARCRYDAKRLPRDSSMRRFLSCSILMLVAIA